MNPLFFLVSEAMRNYELLVEEFEQLSTTCVSLDTMAGRDAIWSTSKTLIKRSP